MTDEGKKTWDMEATSTLWAGWQRIAVIYNMTETDAENHAKNLLPCFDGAKEMRLKETAK